VGGKEWPYNAAYRYDSASIDDAFADGSIGDGMSVLTFAESVKLDWTNQKAFPKNLTGE
jgi:hypothetical protein